MNFHTVRALADYAHSLGMKLAIENLSRDIVANYVRDIVDIKRVIAGAGNPAGVGINVDTGHANISGLDPAAMIREAGSLLIETHFNDNFGWMEPVNATNDIHRVPGIGTVPWVPVISALVEIAYPNPVIFELGPKFAQDAVDTFIMLAYHNWRQFEAVAEFHRATLGTTLSVA
jgi:sugar phosphate isomerase/epimerase